MSVCPRKPNNVLMGDEQPSVAAGLGRVRSKQPRNGWNGVAVTAGLEPSFGANPAPAHCEGSVNPETGAPLESTHGAFREESMIPRLSCSLRNVCCKVAPSFRLWIPLEYEMSERTPTLVSVRSWETVSCWSGFRSAKGLL